MLKLDSVLTPPSQKPGGLIAPASNGAHCWLGGSSIGGLLFENCIGCNSLVSGTARQLIPRLITLATSKGFGEVPGPSYNHRLPVLNSATTVISVRCSGKT